MEQRRTKFHTNMELIRIPDFSLMALVCPGFLFRVTFMVGNTLITEGTSGRQGFSNGGFRSRRYGPDHPAVAGRNLDPARHANLNRLYAP